MPCWSRLIFGWLFSKAFTANIKILKDGAERLSDGDLSRKVRLRKGLFSDETEDLANSLNLVVDSLRNLAGQIRNSSVNVNESSLALSTTAEEMTATAHEVGRFDRTDQQGGGNPGGDGRTRIQGYPGNGRSRSNWSQGRPASCRCLPRRPPWRPGKGRE